jgi:protein-L-isoaspartate(D-aspartate) O-methyltransferase
MAERVYTIERFGELSERAQAALTTLGYENIEFAVADGSGGWPEPKEFDRVIVTAAMPEIPLPLNQQLKEGGLIVAPVGGVWTQELIAANKQKGHLSVKPVCGCRFVKLVGQYAYPE